MKKVIISMLSLGIVLVGVSVVCGGTAVVTPKPSVIYHGPEHWSGSRAVSKPFVLASEETIVIRADDVQFSNDATKSGYRIVGNSVIIDGNKLVMNTTGGNVKGIIAQGGGQTAFFTKRNEVQLQTTLPKNSDMVKAVQSKIESIGGNFVVRIVNK